MATSTPPNNEGLEPINRDDPSHLSKGGEDRERRDIVSGEVMDEARLIRFVAGPDGSVVPDLARKLPGRGFWIEARRESVDQAIKKGLFSKAARQRLLAEQDLSDRIERLLARRLLDHLGLARREGALVTGFEKVHAALKGGKVGVVIEASDGSADGRNKVLGVAQHLSPVPQIAGFFASDEISLAIGLENVIHVALLAGRRAEHWAIEARKLAGFRPIFPERWREEARTGRDGDVLARFGVLNEQMAGSPRPGDE